MTAALELSYLHDNATELHELYDASDGLEHLALHAGIALEGAEPQEILAWAIDRFGPRFVIASSMADAVLAHMAASVRPGVRVLFLDTGYHFAETLGTADAVETVVPIQLLRVRPEQTVAEQYVPSLVLAGGSPGENHLVRLLDDRTMIDHRATAYVCRGYACDKPVTDAESLAEQLENAARAGAVATA